MTPADLKARLDSGDTPVVVDVRNDYEREIADLPDCDQLRIPHDELPGRVSEVDAARGNGTRDVVIYCRTGGRAGWATSFLIESGRSGIFNLEGGVMGWRENVDPSLAAY